MYNTVTIPFKAVTGIVNRKITNSNENNRLKNLGLSGSIGFRLPLEVRHFPINSIFHEAPIIRP